MGSCAAPSAKGDDKFITTDYLQQCPNRKRQDIVTLVKRQLTREISEGRFTANREAVKREVERRVKERMILSRNRNYSRLATASP